MAHSQISSAVMYATFTGVKQALASDDVAGIQSVYGAFPSDPTNNGSSTAATVITSYINSGGQIAIPNLAINTPADTDWYYVPVPSSTGGTMTVRMQSSTLSSLSPRITVYNAAQQGLAQAYASNSFGATLSVTITVVAPGQGYYLRASAAPGYGAVGAYGLLVNFGSSPQAAIAPPNTVVAQQPDQGGGSMAESSGGQDIEEPGWIRVGTLRGYGEALSLADDRTGSPHPASASAGLVFI
jgi:hypothetical protein